jgi:hypothetical protein
MEIKEEKAQWREGVQRVFTKDELITFGQDVREYLSGDSPLPIPLEPRMRMEHVVARLLALACAHCLRLRFPGFRRYKAATTATNLRDLEFYSFQWETVQDTLDSFLSIKNSSNSRAPSKPRAARALISSGGDHDAFVDALGDQARQACHRAMDQALRVISIERRRVFSPEALEELPDNRVDPDAPDPKLALESLIGDDRRAGTRLRMLLHYLLLKSPLPWQRAKLATFLDAPSNASLKLTVLLGDAYRSGAHPRRALEAFESLELGAGGARVAELLDRIDAQARGDTDDPRRFGHILQPHVFAILRELGLQFPHNDDSARKAVSRLQQELIATLRRNPEFLRGPDEDRHKDE